MKKYMTGLIAVIVAVGLSSFDAMQSPKEPFDTLWFQNSVGNPQSYQGTPCGGNKKCYQFLDGADRQVFTNQALTIPAPGPTP